MVQCSKRRYHTIEAAQMALLETKIARSLHKNRKRREDRIYYHKLCKSWHITSMPIGEYDEHSQERMQEKSERKTSMDTP